MTVETEVEAGASGRDEREDQSGPDPTRAAAPLPCAGGPVEPCLDLLDALEPTGHRALPFGGGGIPAPGTSRIAALDAVHGSRG